MKHSSMCEMHMTMNCPLCFPKSGSPAAPPSGAVPATTAAPEPTMTVISSTPLDPHSLEIITAAETFAQANAAVAAFTKRMLELKEDLSVTKQKLDEAMVAREKARNNLVDLAKENP